MSFGFGLSDFALCARVAYDIYQALKQAPETCHLFSLEILHLYDILTSLHGDLRRELTTEQWLQPSLLAQEKSVLSQYGTRCLKLLLEDIGGCAGFAGNCDWREYPWRLHGYVEDYVSTHDRCHGNDDRSQLIGHLRERFRQAKFARKIPKYPEAVAGIVGKLTSEKVIVLGYVASPSKR